MSKVFYKYKPQHSELFKDVVFVVEATDYEMVEKWIKHFSLHIRYDSNTRWAQCDAENFHNCIDSIREG